MSDPFIAEIRIFGGNFAPRGYAFCHGQLLAISQYSALFSLLGTTYGGDGETTFGLPDLRGRFPLQAGNGPGLSSRQLGAKGGQEEVTLTTADIPSHTHNYTPRANSGAPNETSPAGNFPANAAAVGDIYNSAANADMGQSTTAGAGGSQSHNNMPPFTTVNFIIALQGTFPSRN